MNRRADIIDLSQGGGIRAKRAIDNAKRAWNQIWDASGGWGDKFTHNIRRLMDELQDTRSFDDALMAEAIRLHVKETKGKKTGLWE